MVKKYATSPAWNIDPKKIERMQMRLEKVMYDEAIFMRKHGVSLSDISKVFKTSATNITNFLKQQS